MSLGEPREHLPTVGSTNARARDLVGQGAAHGTLVTADEQTAGRGRQGRGWVTPPGVAIAASLILREFDALLPLRAGLAVADVAGPNALVKWPNDVWIDGRKVAGILVEGRPQEGWAVLGVGLNVTTETFPDELVATATSLRLSGIEVEPETVLGNLLRSLAGWLGAPPTRVLDAWRSRDALKGERVRWTGGEGVADGIDDSGALVVETSTRVVTLDAGEVHLLR
jgi:BirA family transcriptional regulator, biotin operon repressor / biotin---[acetyl-CoA-carboxylase] ligase